MKPLTAILVLLLLASTAGAVFILKYEKKTVIENTLTPGVDEETPGVDAPATSTPEIQNISTSTEDIAENLILQAEILISEAQKFIDQENAKLALIKRAQEKSSQIRGIYIGSSRGAKNFQTILDETELNALVVDVKESYGQNLPLSLKSLISDLHKKDNWAIARIVVFRDSSLVEEKPEWYLTTTTDTVTTTLLWRDSANQSWLDPQNEEVQNYIIEFAKKAIDYGFDELQFDYIRYPDDYDYVLGTEKIKVIGDLFSKISEELRAYRPDIILSVDLFGYIATQYQSFDIGQRLSDAVKYFDYLSFMLYPSHFYSGFASKGITYAYPEVVSHPYEVIYYSVKASRDYLALFDSNAKIRPWLQNFDLKQDRDRQVFYDAEKIRLQIDGSEHATSSGWLLWNPSYIYMRNALASSTEAGY